MNHYYKSVTSENWFDYQKFYSSAVMEFGHGSHFIEVGSWKGQSSCYMAVEIINSNKNIRFDCVDTWKIDTDQSEFWKSISVDTGIDLYDIFLQNIEPVKNYINIVRELSRIAADRYSDNSIDFVFIDAAHDYESVTNDLIAWYPKIKIGGMLAGHDYFNRHVEVKCAVDNFFNSRGIEVLFSDDKCWYIKNV